jgi:hypothetical protein
MSDPMAFFANAVTVATGIVLAVSWYRGRRGK